MIEIIPAIDIIDGKCVRLSQGDFATKKIYNEHPLEIAKQFEAAGIRRLHIVDLDGAKTGEIVNIAVLKAVTSQTDLQVDYGGGIKTDADIEAVFNAGAAFACIGSIAVKQPEVLLKWISTIGADKIILGADVKDKKIAINGWQQETETGIINFIQQYQKEGISNILCTDIAKDGMLQGTAIDLYKQIIENCIGIELIASGGVACMQDIMELEAIGCKSVVIGKALYEGKISLKELEKYIA